MFNYVLADISVYLDLSLVQTSQFTTGTSERNERSLSDPILHVRSGTMDLFRGSPTPHSLRHSGRFQEFFVAICHFTVGTGVMFNDVRPIVLEPRNANALFLNALGDR